jgi:hypothetical protein
MKTLLWQAHYLLGRIHVRTKSPAKAEAEYIKANTVLDIIISSLDMELKKTFLNKSEIIDFYADLKEIETGKGHDKKHE